MSTLDQMPSEMSPHVPAPASSPWLTVGQAASRAQCGVKTIYREVQYRRLRAARLGGRRELRLRAEWIDDWLSACATISLTDGVGRETRH